MTQEFISIHKDQDQIDKKLLNDHVIRSKKRNFCTHLLLISHYIMYCHVQTARGGVIRHLSGLKTRFWVRI